MDLSCYHKKNLYLASLLLVIHGCEGINLNTFFAGLHCFFTEVEHSWPLDAVPEDNTLNQQFGLNEFHALYQQQESLIL